MTSTTEDVVRRAVGGLLRGDYHGDFLCSPCLVKLIRERLGSNYSTSKIERAIDSVFKSPGAIKCVPAFICGLCQKSMPCLGVPSP